MSVARWQNYETSLEENMRASYVTFILSYYPSLDRNLPRPPRHSCHAVYRPGGRVTVSDWSSSCCCNTLDGN